MQIAEIKNIIITKLKDDNIKEIQSENGSFTILLTTSDDSRFRIVINKMPSESRKCRKREIIKEFNKKYNEK